MDVVIAKLTLFVQTRCCSYKVDVRTKFEHYSYKTVDVLCPKQDYLLPKVNVVFAKCGRCFHKVNVLSTKFCTKEEEDWQVNF